MQSTMLLERSHWSDDNGKYRDEAQPFHYVHPSTPNPRISPPPHPLPPHPYRQRIQKTYYQQVSQIASCARKLGGTPCTETKDDSAAKSVYCASAQTLEFRECFRKLIFQSFPSETKKKNLKWHRHIPANALNVPRLCLLIFSRKWSMNLSRLG